MDMDKWNVIWTFEDWCFSWIDHWTDAYGPGWAAALTMFWFMFVPLSPYLFYVARYIWKEEKEWIKLEREIREEREREEAERLEREAA